MTRDGKRLIWGGIVIVLTSVVFILPFLFAFFQAAKSQTEAAKLAFSWPSEWHLFANLLEVIRIRDYQLLLAFMNSTIITVAGVTGLVIFASMVGFVLQRRQSKYNGLVNFLVLAGLMIPPAVVPTIWLLQEIGLFKTLHGMVLIEIAYNLSFSILLYRAFVATIPRDLDEAAIMDGATPWQVYFKVIFPLLKPVTVTNIVIQSIAIFNDFVNPLYYLPGKENVTVQLTLYNFQSQFTTSYHLLFSNVLLVTIPPLVVFVFFNRQIVAGMTAGAVKG